MEILQITGDGNSYKTIQLASQVWFAENLRSEFDNQGSSIIYYCLSNSQPNCDTLGHWYSFEVSKTACPQGCKIPTDADWKELERYLGIPESELQKMDANRGKGIGTQLKEGGDSLLEMNLVGAIIAPNNPDDGAVFENEQAIFWTMFNTNATLRALQNDHGAVYRTNIEIDYFATCLRCIKE